jgi:hypothetical protein
VVQRHCGHGVAAYRETRLSICAAASRAQRHVWLITAGSRVCGFLALDSKCIATRSIHCCISWCACGSRRSPGAVASCVALEVSVTRTPNAGMVKCHHGADKFIERYFYDCVYKCVLRLQSALPPAQQSAQPMLPLCAAPGTTWGLSWVLQPSCFGFWLRCVRRGVSQQVLPLHQQQLPLTGCSCLQLPQFITNYKNKSAEALSPWFLAQWLLVGRAAAGPGPSCAASCVPAFIPTPSAAADDCQQGLYC